MPCIGARPFILNRSIDNSDCGNGMNMRPDDYDDWLDTERVFSRTLWGIVAIAVLTFLVYLLAGLI